MRVISGTLRGKKLSTLDGLATRPTLDRVKEPLFSILQFNILEANVLDLFAGSGAIGIESISRGARFATFCDNSPEAVKVINKNLLDTRLTNKSLVLNKDFISTLQYLSEANEEFDIIFLDPPYKTDFGIKAINKIIEADLLSEDGIVVLETDDKNKQIEIEQIKNIKIYDIRKYGNVMLIFIRKG